jgi:hypothetical protein
MRGQRFVSQPFFGRTRLRTVVGGKVQVRPRRKRDALNKNEQSLNAFLESKPMTDRGQVVAHRMHPGSFRIGVDGKKCFFHPDVKVILQRNDMTTWAEYWDAKARWKKRDKVTRHVIGDTVHMEDDARVKIMAAAAQFPEEQFVIASQLPDGTWEQILV